MKKFILLFIVMSSVVTVNFAQNANRERMKLLKTSYITDALSLTLDEAELFWPVYNKHMNKIEDLKRQLEMGTQKSIQDFGGIEAISNENAETILKKNMQVEQELYQTKILLFNDLSKILPAKKILTLQRVEREFNRRLLAEYGKRKRMMNN
jgi:hypothetical protein